MRLSMNKIVCYITYIMGSCVGDTRIMDIVIMTTIFFFLFFFFFAATSVDASHPSSHCKLALFMSLLNVE